VNNDPTTTIGAIINKIYNNFNIMKKSQGNSYSKEVKNE
jgi:hypothetical protein